MKRFNNTDRKGVNAVEKIILDANWIPRSVFQTDVGIDMEVEVCEDEEPTGQLIAIQIKTGESYFKEIVFDNIIYRGNLVHLKYWLKHCLPVILVLHNPVTGQTIWQNIDEEKITRTKTGWKIPIPKSQILSMESLNEIKKFNRLPVYFQRLQRLAVHKKLITKISRGKTLIVEIEEWINKTSGRAKVTLKKIDKEGNDIVISEGTYFHFHGVESLELLYPWAKFQIDDEYYYDYEHDEFLNNYGIWDPEDQKYISSTIEFIEYRNNLPEIRAIEDASGEMQTYRLEMLLNDLGLSFLKLNDYLENGIQLKLKL